MEEMTGVVVEGGSQFLGFALVLAGALLLGTALAFVLKLLRGSGAQRDSLRGIILHAIAKALPPVFLGTGIGIALNQFHLPEKFVTSVSYADELLFIYAAAIALMRLAEIPQVLLERRANHGDSGRIDTLLAPFITKTLKVTIVVLALANVAQVFSDKPLTTIIAGLGVGGVAIALAAQDTVKNFFGSLVLIGDKPFRLGDRIVVDSFDGIVEGVGFRSTRIRNLDGHLVTFPNGELANKTITNIAERPNIKKTFTLGLTYDTSPEKVQEAIRILEELFAHHEGFHQDLPPRIHFVEFANFSLNIQVIFWYHPADFWKFTQFCQKINFQILEKFNANGIEFAFPTQTLFLSGDPNRPLSTKTLTS